MAMCLICCLSLSRTAFVSRPGFKFVVADFSARECRVLAWLAGEQWVLDTFANNGDIYCCDCKPYVPLQSREAWRKCRTEAERQASNTVLRVRRRCRGTDQHGRIVVRHRHKQSDIRPSAAFQAGRSAPASGTADAGLLFDAVLDSELLCSHTENDAVEHIALVAEVIRLRIVFQQAGVFGQQRELLSC